MANEHEHISDKEDKPLEKMTVKDLREIALAIPHEHTGVAVSDMKKDELVAFIKQARGIAGDSPSGRRGSGEAMTRGEIKQRIRDLRTERRSARGSGEKVLSGILRRKISRLKKLSRKTA